MHVVENHPAVRSQRAGHDVGQQARAVASAERGVAEQAGVAADPGGALADSRLPERRAIPSQDLRAIPGRCGIFLRCQRQWIERMRAYLHLLHPCRTGCRPRTINPRGRGQPSSLSSSAGAAAASPARPLIELRFCEFEVESSAARRLTVAGGGIGFVRKARCAQHCAIRRSIRRLACRAGRVCGNARIMRLPRSGSPASAGSRS